MVHDIISVITLNALLIYCVANARLFKCGFSHPRARYFLLRCQKKVSKEKATRMPLASCISRIYRELYPQGINQKGLPVPFANSRHPCRDPIGLFPINAPMLSAAYGILPILKNCVGRNSEVYSAVCVDSTFGAMPFSYCSLPC
jgi:hypothetical protein